VLEWTQAIALSREGRGKEEGGRVCGVRAMDVRTGEMTGHLTDVLVLATGGAGRLYSVSTNPEVATGDGIAMAYRAGAEITDMEFIQFHPTALRLPGVQPFLISEAMRGEGGFLVDASGLRFMPEYDARAELAPRDIVARAILERMQATGSDHVLLDMTQLGAEHLAARFPQIYRFCMEAGLDITREPIPVSPAAHYTMGGVRTNVWGETTAPGLYACGECACTGVHGANRLASNSLLETVVFAKRVVERTLASPETSAAPSLSLCELDTPEPGEAGPLTKAALQELMWREVGIVRDRESLARAKAVLSSWSFESLGMSGERSCRESQELADMLTCARLVTEAALTREESRGAHFRRDFPAPREEWRRHLMWRCEV
jgi:Aspartate oxidase